MSRFRFLMALLSLASFAGSPLALAKDSPTPLIKAVQSGKLERVARQLDAGKNDLEATFHGQTPFFFAIQAGKRDIAALLQARGASVTRMVRHPDSRWESNGISEVSYLGYAVEKGDVDLVRWLLEKGANPHVGESFWKRPALHMAAQAGNAEMVRLMLATGMSPDTTDVFKNTALGSAAEAAKAEIVQILLSAGARVDPRNESGITPLMDVFRPVTKVLPADQLVTAKVLIDAGADVNAYSDYVGPPLQAFISVDSSGAFKVDAGPFAQEATDFLLSRGATYAAVNAWAVRTNKLRAQDAVDLARYEAAQKEAALAREREREAERVAAASERAQPPAGSCSCTKRSMRWVPGREQLRGYYDFFDVTVPCPCR